MNESHTKSVRDKVDYLLKILQDAEVIRVGSSGPLLVVEKNLSFSTTLTGEDDNEVVLISWDDFDNRDSSIKLTEGGLRDAQVYNNCITLEDHEGEEIDLYLYLLTHWRITV